ncbi:dolichyl-phosphate beta-glucosyltransferase [Streptomyces indicus]|uniref:dolichyl-phosphate beta-glucosyltransferase n=1 Tax=Streptomyces indicus TaxID=417292 RepID=A0A1G9CDR6_9ACTN|nr:dolichyl-phosphate beta-glucosyltransferase [Streptomyces indicus]SDK49811.1 dolichyl-phosphate beta-glucosyltransferase [Streptomyces indicus]
MAIELTVVVPAYNEQERLRPTLDAIAAHLGDTRTWELIVVDDGSSDRTRRIAHEAAVAEPRIRVLPGDTNHGKGHALRRGVLASRGERVLITDADLAAPIGELERLDKALADGHAAAIGSRAASGARIEKHQHPVRETLGRAGNLLIRLLAVPGIRDTQCGFKLFDGERARAAFAASRLDGWAIDVEVLQFFRRHRLPVAEVPVRWSHQDGSKVRARDYLSVLRELSVLKARALDRGSLAVAGLFVLASFLLYKNRWSDPDGRYIPDSLQDQNQWEWFFDVTAHNVLHLQNPLFTDLQGFPDGVNLMANTVMLGLSVPFTPVTALFGPALSLQLVMTLGLAATAYAWYWLIRRHVTRERVPAAVGAALAAFAPPMISHANAHPNFIVLFMLPLIIDRALRLVTGDRVVRDGVVLGLFAAYQIFLGEEPLLLAAMGLLLFAAGYSVVRKDVFADAWRPVLRGLGIAAAVCVPIVAFPLWWQFFGPQSYSDVLHGPNTANSPLALVSFAERSLAGDRANSQSLAMNITEQNAFYGWPLLALAVGIVVRLWDRALVKALAFTGFAAALLSLGSRFEIPGTAITVTGPWRALAHQPLFSAVIESRLAMICAPVLGLLIALALTRLRTARPAHRLWGGVAVAAALIPIVPLPLKAVDRIPVPAFVTEGMYEAYVDEASGETLVPVPLPDPGVAEPLHWQTAADLGFKLPGGYFNGPWGPERKGIYGAVPRHTSNLLAEVRGTGEVPALGEAWQEQARRDLAYWKAGALVLAPQHHQDALRETVTRLLGGQQPEFVGGVWVWDLEPAGG